MFNLFRSSKVRQLLVLMLVFTLSWTATACGGGETAIKGGGTLNASPSVSSPSALPSAPMVNATQGNTAIADGKYGVQQATYNDGDGQYTVFLLNTPPGASATFRTANLQMAQLTEEEIAAAQSAYLKVNGGQASLHIPKEFKLDYVHNVAEAVENPQTGQTETRIVRQESSFWSPFAGALAGQAIGNMLFSPRYYVPPMYQSGGGLTGFGGYGNSYGQAVETYRQKYQAPPAAERNRTVFRTTQRTPNLGSRPSSTPKSSFGSSTGQRSTGKGFGSSNLRPSGSSSSSYRRNPSSSFGSGRSSSGSRSFGGRRR